MNSALILFWSAIFTMIGTITANPQTSSPAPPAAKSIEELVNRYFDSLNEPDTKLRRDLTKQVWAEKGKFGTPYGEVEGLDAIDALVAGVQKKFPKATVRRTTKIDGFGVYLRWGFTLSDADGLPILSGVDFAIVDNGKLQLVMGFFDFAPKLESK